MDGHSGFFYMLGIVTMFIVALVVINFSDLRNPNVIINNKSFDCNNIRYNVTIDSVKTDSLYGRTWRK